MPDPFRLPRIKTLDRIVDALGRPTVQFIKFFNVDFAGTIERQEAAQADIIADIVYLNAQQDNLLFDLQAEVDRLSAVLAGTGETFTGLSVGGVQVKPFLDKTDGSKLTDSSGLDGGVVTPLALGAGAANQLLSAITGAGVSVPVAYTTLQTLVVTTIAGETVDLFGQFQFTELAEALNEPVLSANWKRNGVDIGVPTLLLGQDITRAASATRYVLASGTASVAAVDMPGAGTHTYDLETIFTVSGTATNRYGRIITATRP